MRDYVGSTLACKLPATYHALRTFKVLQGTTRKPMFPKTYTLNPKPLNP